MLIYSDNNSRAINMKRVADKVLADKYTITSFVHSHPRNIVPSGFIHPNRNAGDKVVASLFVKSKGV